MNSLLLLAAVVLFVVAAVVGFTSGDTKGFDTLIGAGLAAFAASFLAVGLASYVRRVPPG